MGQYYKPFNLVKKECLYSHDYDNGLKLMEHSWVGNNFVGTVEKLLQPGGRWYKDPIVWAGDYADPEVDENGNILKREYDGEQYDMNLYDFESEGKAVLIKPNESDHQKRFKYVVNHTKKEFVNMDTAPTTTMKYYDGTTAEWTVHPLPLLTCEGNGRGGGDFRDDNKFVGKWSRDSISIESRKPKGYTEIKPDFAESY